MDTSLATRMGSRISSADYFCSFEVSPPKQEDGYCEVLETLLNLQTESGSLFISISWHMYEDKKLRALKLAKGIQDKNSVLLNLSGSGLDRSLAKSILQQAKHLGVNSIFALRGDRFGRVQVENGFPYAVDLVRFIRQKFSSATICVAGYPEGHPDAVSLHQDLLHLKQKVDAGADFIITQFCFQPDKIIDFVKKCREIGITVPIIPGILPLQDWVTTLKMVQICDVQIPEDMISILENIKYNNESLEEYGVHFAVNTAQKIFASETSYGIHLFTTNRKSAAWKIFKQLGFITTGPSRSALCDLESQQTEEETSDTLYSSDILVTEHILA